MQLVGLLPGELLAALLAAVSIGVLRRLPLHAH